MKMSVATVCLSGGLGEKLQAIAAAAAAAHRTGAVVSLV